MVWSELDADDRARIVASVIENPDKVDEIAVQNGLRSSSLERKIRQIKSIQVSGEDLYKRKISYLNPEKEMRVFVYSDTHFPNGDKLALAAALEICHKYEPDIIIGLGDALDAYHFSRFSKRPRSVPTIQREIDAWSEWAESLTAVATSGLRNATFHFLGGNHDARIQKSLSLIPGLSDLVSLELDSVLGIKELGWNPVVDMIYLNSTDEKDYPDPDLIFYHGDSARKWSGSSARALSEKLSGVSVVVGHSHRTGVITRRTSRGITRSYEVGCLCSMQVEYDVYPDWTHSVLLGTISPSGFDFFPVIIDRGVYYFEGKRYEAGRQSF